MSLKGGQCSDVAKKLTTPAGVLTLNDMTVTLRYLPNHNSPKSYKNAILTSF